MARYAAEHKEATRRRILDTAGRRFRQDGLDGSGIATLMKDAGLTNGAFYAHFASKDDLVAHVISEQLHAQADRYRRVEGLAGLVDAITEYLSVEHREQRREGCPSAALLGEVARSSPEARAAYTAGILEIADVVGSHVDPASPSRVRVTILGVLASMIGTLQLARAIDDPDLSAQVLEQGRRTALATLAPPGTRDA